MPTGIYPRDNDHTKVIDGQELVDLIEAGNILFLTRPGVRYLMKIGKLTPHKYFNKRWWVLKSEVIELRDKRDIEAKESAETSYQNHLNKLKEWHKTMTAERRCHWCGKPSAPNYANACIDHIESVRNASRKSRQKQTARRKERGLCVNCGRRYARKGLTTCYLCGALSATRNRNRRKAASLAFQFLIEEGGLVDVATAREIIGVSKAFVHNLIKDGVLKVAMKAKSKYWLEEKAVKSFASDWKKMNKSTVKCLNCGHKWRPQKGVQLRCPIIGCRSLSVRSIDWAKVRV